MKGKASAKMDGFHLEEWFAPNEWLSIKGMVSNKKIVFSKKTSPH